VLRGRGTPGAAARRLAVAAVATFAVAAPAYFAAVRWHLLPARPAVVWPLALLPLAALHLGIRADSRLAIALATLELAACVPLHGLLSFLRDWGLG
jgi:hypothetical protein